MAEVSGLELPDGPYATLGGFVMAELGRLPQTGDVVEHDGRAARRGPRSTGRRAARVRVTPRPVEDAPPKAGRPAAMPAGIRA